jgi:hypothetical protein
MAAKILFICGYAQSGKDTVATMCSCEYGFRRLAFADALKRACAAEHNLPLELFFDNATKDAPLVGSTKTPRDLVLAHAIVARARDMDVYSKQIVTEIRWSQKPIPVVISDWRYLREYDFIVSKFPDAHIMRVRVVRDGVVPSSDPSEHDLDDTPMDAVIHNNGTIEDLREAVRQLLNTVSQF